MLWSLQNRHRPTDNNSRGRDAMDRLRRCVVRWLRVSLDTHSHHYCDGRCECP